LLILDDDGHQCAPGVVGTIYGKDTMRPHFGVEYFNAPDKTESSRRGEYFTVGDMGYLDDDGWLFMSDRRIDLIIAGGVNIYPAEIETVLVEHSSIVDAVVFGTPNDEWGQEITAVIEPISSIAPSELIDDVREFLSTRLPKFKQPRNIIVEHSMPRFSFGKIDRRRLRDRYSSPPAP
jgi:long-chain acyl-CoA synthetase